MLILILISEFFLRFALLMTEKKLNQPRREEDEEKLERDANAAFLRSSEDVYIDANDGIRLHAYFHGGTAGKFLISLHGYTGRAYENGIFYRYMAKRGYSILVPDVRAHGKSGGKYISMGLWERDDLLLWIDFLRKRHNAERIALHGVSMGGATVMMASGMNPEGVRAIVEDCGYSSLYEEFSAQMRQMFHLPPHPLLEIVSIWCRIRLGFSFSSINPAEEVKKTDIPMLFIHGNEDTFVPFGMVYDAYNAHHGQKELFITEGVKHALSMPTYKDEYSLRAFNFIERYI